MQTPEILRGTEMAKIKPEDLEKMNLVVFDIEGSGSVPGSTPYESGSIVSLGAVDFNTKGEFYEECRVMGGRSYDDYALKINCKSGESDMCIKGDYLERGIKGEHGYMAEYYKEKQEYLVKIPKEISEVAVMLEPFSIAEKAAKQVLEAQKRMVWQPKSAIVLGTGTVGLFAAMILRLNGMDVVSVDRTATNAIKDRIYKEMGIEHINSNDVPIEKLPDKLGKRVDLVVELTGSPKAVASSLNVPSINGVLCLLSVTGESYSESVDIGRLNYNMVLGNKLILGSVNSNISHFIKGTQDMAAIESQHPGLLKTMITRKIKLEDFSYEMLNDREQIKNVIIMG